MSQSPRFSIVLPCFNAADTLEDAVRSIQSQTSTQWELLILDDGSTDGSLELAKRLAQSDARIRLLARPHRGIVASLQDACAQASGYYLARMDADDTAHPQRLERQGALLDNNPEVALCGAQVRMVGEGVGSGRRRYEAWLNALTEPEAIARELFIECPIAHPAFCMRRSAYAAVGGYQDQGWPEDYDLVLRCWAAGMQLANVLEVLLDWRNRPQRLSMQDPRYSLAQFRAIKRHYLYRSYLQNNRPFLQWGAGEVGKLWLREWPPQHRPEAVVDINPRKIGKTIHGVPVISPDTLPLPGESFVVVAVGAPGARTELRNWFSKRQYVECRDYLFLA